MDKSCGYKSFSVKLLIIILLILLSAFSFYVGVERYQTKASGTQIFGFENGAWIKAVSQADLEQGGDTNAIRFKFEMNEEFVKANEVTSVRATATISGVTLLDKTFTNINQLVADGAFIQYFDFANIPSSYYDKQITIDVVASFENGESSSVAQSRSIEYVAAAAIANADANSSALYQYVGNGDKVFENQEELSVDANSKVEVRVDNYDGSEFKSVFVNSILIADTSILSASENPNSIVVDTSKLEIGKTYSIIAVTATGNVVSIDSISINEPITQPVEDISYDEIFAGKKTGCATIEFDNDYEVESVIANNLTNLDFELNDGSLKIKDLSLLALGQNTLTVNISNQSSKIIIPLQLFDEYFEIANSEDFNNWYKACCEQNSWDENNSKAKNYIGARLINNIDMVGVDLGDNLEKTSCVSGTVDGNGYSVSNLNITNSAMFYRSQNFIIKNIAFINCNFDGSRFLVYKENESSSTSIINSHFDLTTTKGATPFVNASFIDLIENVVIKTQISYSNSKTCIFKSYDPISVKNFFVIGNNTSHNNTPIKVLNGLDDSYSYLTVEDFKSSVKLDEFDDFWDKEVTSNKIWKNA